MLEKSKKESMLMRRSPRLLKELPLEHKLRLKFTDASTRLYPISPQDLLLSKSSEDSSPKYASPVLKVKAELAEVMSLLNNTSDNVCKIKYACKALKICSNIEGYYSKQMKEIVGYIHDAIFLSRNQVDAEVLSMVYETHTELILDNEVIPYFYIAESMQKLIEQLRKEVALLRSQLDSNKNGRS